MKRFGCSGIDNDNENLLTLKKLENILKSFSVRCFK